VSSWLTGEVDGLANALAPKLAATGDIGSGPWVRPTSNYSVSSEWMRGGTAIHYGIDLAAPMGTPVHSVAAGRVTRAFWNNGYGNFVEVDHGGVYTSYSHLSAILASAGQTVGPGSVIGAIGSTGDSTGPHLHFETRPGGQAVEPRGFMRSRGVELRAGGMVPVNVSNGEWFVPETKAKEHMPLLHAINAGQINGPGTGTSDSIPGAARPGAFVVNAAQTRRNRSLLRSITHGSGPSQYLAGGGVVGSGGAVFAGGAQTVELHISGRVLYGALSDYRRDSGRAVLEFA
jgi:murein DD-endopeptidase MepM/ murein hydrolase activator NlpD